MTGHDIASNSTPDQFSSGPSFSGNPGSRISSRCKCDSANALKTPVVRETVVDQAETDEHRATRHITTVESDFSHHPAPWKWLLPGLLLLLVAFFGRHLVELGFVHGQDEPQRTRSGMVRTLTRPDGPTIHAEVYGPTKAPTLVLTHGWGVSSAKWYYTKRQLSNRFHLIVRDLPGLGLSAQPKDRDFALEKMGRRPAYRVATGRWQASCARGTQYRGHGQSDLLSSVSRTSWLTSCRNRAGRHDLHKPSADHQRREILACTSKTPRGTYTPCDYPAGARGAVPELAQLSDGWPSLQRPQFFRRVRNPGQIDFVSEFQYRSSPAVVARGTLAMFHWDATPVLQHVNTPVLILVGNQDSTTIPAGSERMQQSLPRAQLQRINSGAHYSLLEQNQMVNAAVAQFASGVLK